ncbi:D-serine deaminase-like pyridoxal phosphate-dependent protein [Klebsiella oxytoca]|uniref:D-serine deaminase-like pyridoxal phosphate-dependent protein n=1 Tax=Klebsiella oxytoca TaxID=571 RepID=A0A318FMW4_KLEOX|nr:alanine racemase [Klebsiella oxytoca]PXW43908.1 D-serine deaminase-like pyridoxal phosphate-dependent protein [Klebsiella oxytoca]
MLTTPYVALDMDIMEKNIIAMTSGLARNNIQHWPHIKTHKSVRLAKLEQELGASGITCAKLSEAEVMAAGGITSILLAYPLIGDDKCQRYAELARKVTLRTIVDSLFGAEGLSRAAVRNGLTFDIDIAIDFGAHREGIQPEQLLDFARTVTELPGLNICGVFTYAGTIYQYRNEPDIRRASREEAMLLIQSRDILNAHGFAIEVLSGGSTLSSFYADELNGITESRAGNFIFGDMNAINGGIYTPENCALTICSTIVSIPLPGYATLDAGTKSLTSDLSATAGSYGLIQEYPDISLVKLNEEHGYLRYDPEKISLAIGEQVHIIPNHCCVVANLVDEIYAFRNGKLSETIAIDARGKSY